MNKRKLHIRITNETQVIYSMYTFINPAKQWTSIPRGTMPLFNLSRTNSS